MPPWARRTESGWQLRLHVQPGARKTAVAGLHGERLKLKLQAPPVAGKANEALIELLSGRLGVPRAHIAITAGGTGRDKTVEVRDPEARIELLAVHDVS